MKAVERDFIMKEVERDRMDEILAQIPEACKQAVVVTRDDGTIIGINTKTEELFGYSRDELLGHKPEMLMPRRLSTLRWRRFRKH